MNMSKLECSSYEVIDLIHGTEHEGYRGVLDHVQQAWT